jgi:hypothetical protein
LNERIRLIRGAQRLADRSNRRDRGLVPAEQMPIGGLIGSYAPARAVNLNAVAHSHTMRPAVARTHAVQKHVDVDQAGLGVIAPNRVMPAQGFVRGSRNQYDEFLTSIRLEIAEICAREFDAPHARRQLPYCHYTQRPLAAAAGCQGGGVQRGALRG